MTDKPTNKELEALLTLDEHATPAPWVAGYVGPLLPCEPSTILDGKSVVVAEMAHSRFGRDIHIAPTRDLIIELRNNARAIISELLDLRGHKQSLEAEVDRLDEEVATLTNHLESSQQEVKRLTPLADIATGAKDASKDFDECPVCGGNGFICELGGNRPCTTCGGTGGKHEPWA